ncbi:hypothetical protein FRX31_028290 [Thalictrum thalictroides]|uniref:Reverse transcriptase zinc-binding domain-containing protein n=1 Tax=Thalictrum thalictroides TaxID=46969 RepID=A0A7J6VB44_THATH|nr:hypothetical protein FRX31_028290 [Thalictrum thalictroides]
MFSIAVVSMHLKIMMFPHGTIIRFRSVCIPATLEEGEDYCHWEWDRKGAYTVKSMYNCFLELGRDTGDVGVRFSSKLIRNIQIPLKVKMFFWVALHGRTLTMDNLIHRGQDLSPLCQVRGMINETIGRLFLHCSVFINFEKFD